MGDDHHLAVVPHEVVGRPRHSDAVLEQSHLQLSKVFLATAIRMRDQCANDDAPSRRRFERPGDLLQSRRKISTSIVFWAQKKVCWRYYVREAVRFIRVELGAGEG